MSRFRGKKALIPSLLLALLLLTAQFAGLAHAVEHDPGAPQNLTCTSCIAASQLASACTDNPATTGLQTPNSARCAVQDVEFESFRCIVVRQRGPPSAL
jgi:hypothetical protein